MSMLSRFATLGGAPTDPYWANVSYLLVGNGANGTTTNIVDSSSNNLTCTPSGTVTISTAQNKYGSGSVYFDGGGTARVQVAGNTVTNLTGVNFTIECWLYHNSFGSNIYHRLYSWQTSSDYLLEITKQTSTTYFLGVYCGGLYITSGTITLANTNQWQYLTFVRNGNNGLFFINGVLVQTSSFSPSTVGNTGNTELGYTSVYPGLYTLNGYLYDLRVTKGVARYTATFTPPTAPLPTTGP